MRFVYKMQYYNKIIRKEKPGGGGYVYKKI
jgi:hypothetical protein